MEASTFSTTAVAVRPVLFTPEEELALLGFLAGYSGLTRDAYALDLRQYVAWCTERDITMFVARRSDIEALGLERGHRTLTIVRKGGKVVTIPLAPRTARAIDLAVGERCEGPIFFGADGGRLDRHAAGRIVRRIADERGSPSESDPTLCGVHHRRVERLRSSDRRAHEPSDGRFSRRCTARGRPIASIPSTAPAATATA